MFMWYKDAIIYELHVKSFFDANGDGIGDFRGLINKLDYLQDLGVTAIWLLPFYPSPLRDDGYDIADYKGINPDYGNLRDFRRFLRAAHDRGLRVITELVINHTSDQHKWFQRARHKKRGSVWRDFYVWSDNPEAYSEARVIFQDFEHSNWTWDPVAHAYYWHRFYSHQPDLNYRNPRVREQVKRIMDFWLDMGVDGLRLDAVPYLFEEEGTNCENLPETHAYLQDLRAHIDRHHEGCMLLAEANQWPQDAAAYFGDGDECHMAFHFPVMPRLFMALRTEDRFPVVDMIEQSGEIPSTCQWAMFLRNHDELTLEMVTDEERDYMYRAFAMDPKARINVGIRRRLAPLLDNNRRRMELMNSLLLSLPGTPVIYYGDEIGMGDNYHLGDRDGVRTPMQWTGDRNAGFSRCDPQRLFLPAIIDLEYHYTAVNVEKQQNNSSSFLWFMKRLIALRKQYRAFGRGTIEFPPSDNSSVLAFIRRHESETLLVVANLSRFCQAAQLDLADYAGTEVVDMFSANRFPAIDSHPYIVTLGPHSFYWFLLHRAPSTELETKETPLVEIASTWSRLPANREELERLTPLLRSYLHSCRWFGGKGKTLRSVAIEDAVTGGRGDQSTHMLLLNVSYAGAASEYYLLPLSFASEEAAWGVRDEAAGAVVGDVSLRGEKGVVYDAVHDPAFRQYLLEVFTSRRRAGKRKLAPAKGAKLRTFLKETPMPTRSRVLRVEQSNTSIIYGETFFLKLFRRLDSGLNPDVELSRHLTEETGFENFPTYFGALEWHRNESVHLNVGLLLEFVPNEGDAWTYMINAAEQYLTQVLVEHDHMEEPDTVPLSLADGGSAELPEVMRDLIGAIHLERAELLGKRTAEMHLALASLSGDDAVRPEPFSLLYQKSVYQSMRTLTVRVFTELNQNLKSLDAEAADAARRLLSRKSEILDRLARIADVKIAASRIRIHGDFHLGQVLYTGRDFLVIDFEGEPARPLSERRLKRSVLRDVAGMVRSFHYAAHGAIHLRASLQTEQRDSLSPWAEAWSSYMSAAFLKAYFETVRGAPFIPVDADQRTALFEAFLLEKAVYELGYEINNRPAWLAIPARGLQTILDQSPTRQGTPARDSGR